MANGNEITVFGKISRDAEIKVVQTRRGGSMVTARVTIPSHTYHLDSDGQRVQRTTWIRCSLFGQPAEFIRDYGATKGTSMTIFGQMELQEWTSDDGVKHATVEVHGHRAVLNDNRSDNGDTAPARKSTPQPQQEERDIDLSTAELPF